MKQNDNVHVDISDDVISLLVDKVSVDDEATYAVRIQGSEKDLGEVNLTVLSDVSSIEKQRYNIFYDALYLINSLNYIGSLFLY